MHLLIRTYFHVDFFPLHMFRFCSVELTKKKNCIINKM
uniref:Uncharacterized protein n=1 Tax=Anguilla anguilla TaxID=7936 RepID=A0A0E9REB7_ANGAN